MTNFEGFCEMTAGMGKDIRFSTKDSIETAYLGMIAAYLAQIADALNKMAGIEIKEESNETK